MISPSSSCSISASLGGSSSRRQLPDNAVVRNGLADIPQAKHPTRNFEIFAEEKTDRKRNIQGTDVSLLAQTPNSSPNTVIQSTQKVS